MKYILYFFIKKMEKKHEIKNDENIEEKKEQKEEKKEIMKFIYDGVFNGIEAVNLSIKYISFIQELNKKKNLNLFYQKKKLIK